MKIFELLFLVICFSAGACQRKKDPPPRTEPWPAPIATSASASARVASHAITYVVESGTIRLELPARKQKPRGSLSRVSGTIEWDPRRPEHVRAELRADLLSLSIGFDGAEDSELLARALDWLELSPLRAAEERERDRYAVVRISNCDLGAARDNAARQSAVSCTARGDLTLHRFRVPIAIEVAVELEKGASGSAPGGLLIRLRRPLVVSLTRYDIQPRDRQGQPLPADFSLLGSEIGRDARVSAELRALPRIEPHPKNP